VWTTVTYSACDNRRWPATCTSSRSSTQPRALHGILGRWSRCTRGSLASLTPTKSLRSRIPRTRTPNFRPRAPARSALAHARRCDGSQAVVRLPTGLDEAGEADRSQCACAIAAKRTIRRTVFSQRDLRLFLGLWGSFGSVVFFFVGCAVSASVGVRAAGERSREATTIRSTNSCRLGPATDASFRSQARRGRRQHVSATPACRQRHPRSRAGLSGHPVVGASVDLPPFPGQFGNTTRSSSRRSRMGVLRRVGLPWARVYRDARPSQHPQGASPYYVDRASAERGDCAEGSDSVRELNDADDGSRAPSRGTVRTGRSCAVAIGPSVQVRAS